MGKRDEFRLPPMRPAGPPMIAIDIMGRQIEPGHLVQYHPPAEGLIMEVVNVGPVLNPGIPGGSAVQIKVRCEFNLMGAPATNLRSLTVVGETQARIAERAAKNGQPEVPAPPSNLILLTDQHDKPKAEEEEKEELCGGHVPIVSMCDNCGHTDGDIGATCNACTSGFYVKVE